MKHTMFPNLRKFNAFGMHMQCYVLWIFVALTLPSTGAGDFVGDSCRMKSTSGVCKLASKCPELEQAVRTGKVSTRDIVSCGFDTHEEIICCPGTGVRTDIRSDDRFIFDSTSRRPPTKEPSIAPSTSVITHRTTDRPAVIACREIMAGLSPSLSPHIIGGIPADLGEFPHMAAIGYSSIGSDQAPYDYRCGGTLIASRFVLTAAHCVNSVNSQPVVVLLGLVDLNDEEERSNAEEVKIRQVHIHPEYSSSRTYHDVAILELEREVPYSANIYPTCLDADLKDPPRDSVLYVTGWGQINVATRQRSNRLLKAQLELVPINQCNQSYVQMGLNRRIMQGIQNQQMCAHDTNLRSDACQGDSGGPLNLVEDEALKKYRVIGVISAGFSCGSATPGIYARVAAYLDFIESVVWP